MPSVFYQTRHLKNRKTNRKRWAYTLCDVSYYSATLCPPCHTSILRQPPVRGGLPLELNLRSAMVEAEVVQLLLQVSPLLTEEAGFAKVVVWALFWGHEGPK